MAKGHVQDSLQFTKLILLRRLSYLNLEDVVAVDGTAEMWRQVFGEYSIISFDLNILFYTNNLSKAICRFHIKVLRNQRFYLVRQGQV